MNPPRRASPLRTLVGSVLLAVVASCAGTPASPGRPDAASTGGTTTGGKASSPAGGNGGGAGAGGSNGGGATTGGAPGGGSGGASGSSGSSASGGASGHGGSVGSAGVTTGGTAGGGGSAGGTGARSGGAGGASTGGSLGVGGERTGGAGGSSGAGGASAGGATASGGVSGTGGTRTGGTTGPGGSGSGGTTPGSGGRATGGASGSGGATSDYRPCPTDGTACKIMPFGDSITDGYNADTPGGYRVELFRRAHSAGKNITFVGSGSNGPATVDGVPFPHNHEGHSGWTIAPEGGRSGISTLLTNDSSNQSVMLKYTPHIVLLMIGTNDAIDNYQMADAATRLGSLIDTIYSQLPNVLIVVAQPIPSRGDASKGDDTGLSDRIHTYDNAIPAVVKARADAGKHILVVDMWTPFNPTKASLLEDQWHPNLQGYVVLGTAWYSALQSLL